MHGCQPPASSGLAPVPAGMEIPQVVSNSRPGFVSATLKLTEEPDGEAAAALKTLMLEMCQGVSSIRALHGWGGWGVGWA